VTREEIRRDRDLAGRAAAGEEEAWRMIYDATCQPLFNYLCYQLGSREDARDLLQETYLVAWRNLNRYRGDGPIIAWLRAIALRRSLDWKRRLARRVQRFRELAREMRGEVHEPAYDARLEVGTAAFRRALSQLSPKQRAALLLHDLEDLPFRDVAAQLGCDETTARVHYHRARARMRLVMDPASQTRLAGGVGGQQA
jgi:RNA polymerase sigma-70 factor (ECF subfamily)